MPTYKTDRGGGLGEGKTGGVFFCVTISYFIFFKCIDKEEGKRM